MINPVTQLITDIAAKWDNTNVTGVTTDIQVKSYYDYTNSASNDKMNGVLVLGPYTYNIIEQNAGFRTTRYLVDAILICRKSTTAFDDSINELDRSLNDYNDDATTTRSYYIVSFNNPDNDADLQADFQIQVDIKMEALSV